MKAADELAVIEGGNTEPFAMFPTTLEAFQVDGAQYWLPSTYYYRHRLQRENDPEILRAVGLALALELERVRGWAGAETGCAPPHFMADPAEADSKRALGVW